MFTICHTSFNRYMVECEFNLGNVNTEISAVLIDTWWNVNTFKIYNSSVVVSVLIDTWWNVNEILSVSVLVTH